MQKSKTTKIDPENILQNFYFTTRISKKNMQGGLKHKNVESEIVKNYEQPDIVDG